jgi:adenylate cyclase
MPREIERKFLIKDNSWRPHIDSTQQIAQGYLVLPDTEQTIKSSVRIRITDNNAYITIKSLELGISRDEFEYPIPIEEARHMLKNLCISSIIEKKRHHIPYNNKQWTVDEFMGKHHPLLIAEIELQSEQENIKIPQWAGKEVTNCIKYHNTELSKKQ